jgi:carboxypeptidase T
MSTKECGMFRLTLYFIFTILFSGLSFAQTSQIVRFDLTPSIKKFLKENAFDVTGVNYKTMEIEALLNEEELQLIEKQNTKIKFSFPQNLLAAPDQQYKDPQEIEAFINEIHQKFPEITQIKSIGKSLEGRDIWAIKISDHPEIDEAEPSILFNAMHHAREIMTPEVTTDVVDFLTRLYGFDPEVTEWVNTTEIWVVPMFNVDGNNKMWLEDSMWRKNTRNGHGVDLNRNYPQGWNSCSGSSGNTWAQDYRGTAPASEPETKAMMDLVSEIKPVFDISYHSYSELVIYPFGCRPFRTPSEEAVETIGKEIAQKIDYKPGTAWELLYNADGGDIDWMYKEHQVIPYVIELNSTWVGFHPDYAKWRDKTVERNRAGWQHLLRRLKGPGVFGQFKNNEFEEIKILKTQGQKVHQTYKVNPDGTYFIILNPGRYDFILNGKTKLNINNVLVTKPIELEI